MNGIVIAKSNLKLIEGRRLEYVERKGVGHPDSLIDGIVDNISMELCKEYMDRLGFVLHHNVDKGLIIGGASEVGFGTGKITRKIEVILTGRATEFHGSNKFEINEIAKMTAARYLKENTRFLDLENEVIIDSKIANGSTDLNSIFMRESEAPLANDTSFGVGYAPLSDVENLVLETERFLNSKEYKNRMPSVGEDIKVMGLREGNKILLTVAIAFVSRYVNDIKDYKEQKEKVRQDIIGFAKGKTQRRVNAIINYGDSLERKEIYLTKSGLSCESGDDGSVGRGNRVNGLITPFRYMSLEAAAGKNPINHVGKIYNIFANELAKDIVKRYGDSGVAECHISMLSQIGRRIDDPRSLSINLVLGKRADLKGLKKDIGSLAAEWLSKMTELRHDMQKGKYPVF